MRTVANENRRTSLLSAPVATIAAVLLACGGVVGAGMTANAADDTVLVADCVAPGNGHVGHVGDGGTKPTRPTRPPVEPTTEPTEPTVDPTEPGVRPTDPTEPEYVPTEPTTDPTEPGVDPTEPGVRPTDPTEPEYVPTEPTTDPTDRPTDPVEPASWTESSDEQVTFAMVADVEVPTVADVEACPVPEVTPEIVPDVDPVKTVETALAAPVTGVASTYGVAPTTETATKAVAVKRLATTSSDRLATTGFSAGTLALVAASLVTVGAGALWQRRRVTQSQD